MTITQIRKKYGGMEQEVLSTGELVFKIDDQRVRLVKLETLLKDDDYRDTDLGIFELPIVLFSKDTIKLGYNGNSNESQTISYHQWVSARYLQKYLDNEWPIGYNPIETEEYAPEVYYYFDSEHLYFADYVNDCLWSLSLQIPDMETLKLVETHLPVDKEKEVFNKAKHLYKDGATKLLNIIDKENNRAEIYEVMTKLPIFTEEILDKITERDLHAMEVLNKALDIYCAKNSLEKTHMFLNTYSLYQSVKNYLKDWDDDRTINYMVKRVIYNRLNSHLKPYVDIFGECHPTKYSLLREFYNATEKNQEVMDKAVELFPDYKDIDKAYYYYLENR